MTIVTYRNNSVANKVAKNLTTVDTISGTLRFGTSMMSPTFLIVGTPALAEFNYFKVEEWGRYYFAGPKRYEINNTLTISGVVDVLMSFKDDILKARAIIERQENVFNMYLDDQNVVMNQNPKHKIVAFPNSFTDYSYVLALAGNGQISS